MRTRDVHIIGGPRDGEVLTVSTDLPGILFANRIPGDADHLEEVYCPIQRRADGTYGIDGSKLTD